MAAVTDQLLRRVLKVLHPLEATVFPRAVTAGHGRDILIAHLFHGFGRQKRTHAAGTIGDDRRILVGHRAFDFDFEKAAGQRNRAFQMTLAPLIAFTNIKHNRRLAVIFQQFVDLLRAYTSGISLRASAMIS